MKLYCTLRSPYARKARIIAIEKNISLEICEEDLFNRSDEFIKANPLGKVPTLLLDDGLSLCDSPVICEYLDLLNDDVVFVARELEKRLLDLNRAALADGLMDNTVSIFMEKFRHKDQADHHFIVRQGESILRSLEYFNAHMDWLSRWDIVAVSVFCAIGYIQFRVPHLWDRVNHPELFDWFKEQSLRESATLTEPVAA